MSSFRTELAFAETPDVVAELFLELELELRNEAAQDLAELNAFKVCGCCHRIYSKEQWNQLPPASGGLRRQDDQELTEWRNCQTPVKGPTGELAPCEATLVVVLQVYGAQPLQNARVRREMAGSGLECSGCRRPLALGEDVTVREGRHSGLQQNAPQVTCDACEVRRLLAQSRRAP